MVFSHKLFQVFCPALEYNVILFKQTWDDHIVPGHPIMRGKLGLVKQAVENCVSGQNVFRKKENPDQVSIHYRCPDFLPVNRYLRIALFIKKRNRYAIVASAYPVDNFPGKESERI